MDIKRKELYISDVLVESLKDYGAIKWHKNDNHSFYIKFRDVRLGSIRIANHKGRNKYHYTYEIYKDDKDIERKIDDTIHSIIEKSKSIKDFNPTDVLKKLKFIDEVTTRYKYNTFYDENTNSNSLTTQDSTLTNVTVD